MDQMDAYMTMIVNEESDVSAAVKAMHNWSVCPRCIMRFLGDTLQESYRQTGPELIKWRAQYLDGGAKDDGVVECVSKDSFICVACIGILQDNYCSETYHKHLFEIVQKQDFQFASYYLSLSIPVPLILREFAVFLKLKELLPNIYQDTVKDDITPIKEAWKWASGPAMSRLLRVPFDQRSLFEVKLNFAHPDLEKECHFLYDLFPDVFRQRKNNKHGWEVFTRVNVPNALDIMGDEKFQRNYHCPPRELSAPCDCTSVVCTHEAIFVAGRYNKYSRDLSQTPWVVDGERRTESSIEEMICIHLKDATKAKEYKLSASGREDVDVLMLGRGRPFLVEIINPRRIRFTAEEMKTLQDLINASHKEIRTRDLQIVTKEETKHLKTGEEEKIKTYSALCWANKTITEELIESNLNHRKDMVLKQKTPIRVLHRRALAVRDRTVHKISAKLQDNNHFILHLSTQAGTYIKEFVHGDFGRTVPNLGQILDAECDILELNVDSVDLDWPKQLEDYDPDEDTPVL
jgi:tRNA pseudouridine synthase 10